MRRIMIIPLFLSFFFSMKVFANDNITVSIQDLLDDRIKISSITLPTNQLMTLATTPAGWLSQTAYSGNSCKSNSLYANNGLIINQCLYAPRFKLYFQATCTSTRGFITYYSDSSCRTPINARNNPLIYVLNTCFGYQGWQNTFTTQCTTTNTQSLPLPTMKDLVTFSYYQDNTCNTIVQYSAYAESVCLLGYRQSTSIKYIYPRKISYSNPTCAGSGVTSNLQTNTCFDWVDSYGYSDDDSFTWNADDSYMIVTESTTRAAGPSVSPSYSPTTIPTVSFAPTSTVPPTVSPTVNPSRSGRPTALPTISLAPSNTVAPTVFPTVNPSRSGRPTVVPTISLAPSNTVVPTAVPTVAPSSSPRPTASPPFSLAPTISRSPTNPPRGPTRRPSRARSIPTFSPTQTIDYTVSFSVTQSFDDISCTLFTSSLGKQLLTTLIRLTIAGVKNELSITVNNITTRPNTNCNITYTVILSSILELGFASPDQAYDMSSWKLSVAVSNGDFNDNWTNVATSLKAGGSISNINSTSIVFGNPKTNVASGSNNPNGGSSSSSSNNSAAVIASSIVVSFACFPVLLYLFARVFRHIMSSKLKIHTGDDSDIEMVEARYIDSNAVNDHEEGEFARDDINVLPQARPVSCILAEVEDLE